jgi:SRSO17 transposase
MQMSLPRLRGPSSCHAGMTPEQIAEVRPRLVEFTGGMLGGLARSDQRVAGELYVRGLLTGGRRKSMQPMAARLGVDHQRLQQFITSSTWDYAAVRRNVARWFAGYQPVEALVVDDTGFPKDGPASPCVARQYSGTLGKVGNCQVGVSVHLVNEHASCAADWRLFARNLGMTPRWMTRWRRPLPGGGGSGLASPAGCAIPGSGGWRWR